MPLDLGNQIFDNKPKVFSDQLWLPSLPHPLGWQTPPWAMALLFSIHLPIAARAFGSKMGNIATMFSHQDADPFQTFILNHSKIYLFYFKSNMSENHSKIQIRHDLQTRTPTKSGSSRHAAARRSVAARQPAGATLLGNRGNRHLLGPAPQDSASQEPDRSAGATNFGHSRAMCCSKYQVAVPDEVHTLAILTDY